MKTSKEKSAPGFQFPDRRSQESQPDPTLEFSNAILGSAKGFKCSGGNLHTSQILQCISN